MVAQVRYSVAGRSRGRVALCAVCTVHVETRSAGFLVEPQNQGRWSVSGLALKPLRRFFIGLGLKTDGDGLLVVWPQNHSDGFCWFGLKTGGDGFWQFSVKTCCDGFWRFGLKTCCDGFLWFGLKTSGDGFLWFGLKTSGDGLSWFGLKTGGGFLG
jgi:hypothetical protein